MKQYKIIDEYEIIPISKSFAEYRNEVKDCRYIGDLDGVVNGWQFEYINKDGEYAYGSVSYVRGSAYDYANTFHDPWDGGEWIHETPRMRGYEPTGRVVFRGYAIEYWDEYERDWFVKDYDPSVEYSYIIDGEEE